MYLASVRLRASRDAGVASVYVTPRPTAPTSMAYGEYYGTLVRSGFGLKSQVHTWRQSGFGLPRILPPFPPAMPGVRYVPDYL
ncbi:hypothetical protein TNCV_1011041 [Trichonephila clavipes]|uniref:Uncharacterized protein n=1 Tax=Trichonephila clavipes TaxID=2585209 RepID=A0A8X6VX83_TRICX|nr:hypothetical protein TNCV_1011041 [Trichonephila clavipes]